MKKFLPILAIVATVPACLVSASRYDQAVKDATAAHQQEKLARDQAADTRQKADEQIAALRAELQRAETTLQARDATVSELSTERHNLQARLDEATAIQQQLQGALERTGKDVGAMLKEKGVLQHALDDAKARLAELRATQAAAQNRAKVLTDLAIELKPFVDSKQIAVAMRDGQPVIAIPETVLFEPGKAPIRQSGRPLVVALAHALNSKPGANFQVEGHTVAPVHLARFKSALHLSTMRAQAVADELISSGVAASSLRVGGCGDAEPLVPASSPDAATMNARIEIRVEVAHAGVAAATPATH